MAGIQTTIQLQDRFTSTLYRVIDSVNLGVSVMEELQQTMGSPIDMSAMEAAKEVFQQGVSMAQQWDRAVKGMEAPLLTAEFSPVSLAAMQSALPDHFDIPVEPILTDLSQFSVPDSIEVLVEPRMEVVADPLPLPVPIEPDVPDPLVETPAAVSVPIEWESYDGLDVFTTTGMERFQSEVSQVHLKLDDLTQTQSRITQNASVLQVLSPQAVSDVQGVEQQMGDLLQMIRRVEANPLHVGTEEANIKWERLRVQVNGVLQIQKDLDAAIQDMDLSSANTAYLQLLQSIMDTKRFVRDSFSNLPSMEVPIHWKTDSLPVFTGSGMERFQQEVQSANQMLNTLHQTQNQIVGTAAQTGFFPTDAMVDLGQMQTRLQAIGQKIEQIEQNPITLGSDMASAELEQLRGQLDQAIQGQQKLNRAVEEMDIQAANEAYLQFSQTIRQAEKMLRDHAVMEVPIQWKVDSLPVFTGSGVERFQQEVQSANQMLEQLSHTQDWIAKQAYHIDLFPPESFQSLNQLAVRMDTIRNQIQQIETNPMNLGTDRANAELERLRSQFHQMVQEQAKLNQAMQEMDVYAANAAYLQLSQTIGSTERYIRDNTDAEGQFQTAVQETNRFAQQASGEFRGWQKAIILANQALGLIRSTLGRIGLFNLDGAFNRLDTMNRFQKTVTVMTGDANLATAALEKLKEITLGTAYGLDTAAKATQNFLTRGMSLGAATDQVRIWSDAVSFYGNGTNEQLENVIDAVGKIYSKGTVEQTQLDRLFDAGIGAAELYAQAVGRSVEEVKKDLTNRKISSADFIETVTQALDAGVSAGAAKDAGSTWASTFANLGAAINRGWVDVLTNLDAALASRGLPSAMELIATFGSWMEDALKKVGSAMDCVVDKVMDVYSVLAGVGDFFVENWSIISPIIYGVAAALAVYYGQQMLCAGATAVLAAKEAILNVILSANPIMIIVLAMIALVAIIFAVCNAIAKMTGIANSGFGVMTGGINVVIQFFWNLFLVVGNVALGIINALGALADNMMTAFSNAICSVQSWFYDLLSTALTVVGKICEALNRLPFVEFDYSGITSAAETYAAKAAGVLENKKEYENVGDAFQKGFHTFDTFQEGWVSDAFQAGASWGDEIADRLSGLFRHGEILGKEGDTKEELDNYSDLLENTDLLSSIGNIDDTTKGISKSLDVTEEELKYLRDIAEQEAINRFTTAEIKVEMGGITNQVNGNTDLDGMVDYLVEKLEETMYMTAAGVH